MFFLFSFVHAPECAYCNISCNIVQLFKKKKKKKNNPYYGMGKNAKVMPQMSHYLSFLLGKERESLRLKPYEKSIIASALCDLKPPTCTKLDKASTMRFKIAQSA